MIPMRREREGQRAQMESAIKYMMFGIAATGDVFRDELSLRADRHDSLPAMVAGLGPWSTRRWQSRGSR